VTGPGGYFAEEKREARSEIRMIEAGCRLHMVNTAQDGRWRIEKTVLAIRAARCCCRGHLHGASG